MDITNISNKTDFPAMKNLFFIENSFNEIPAQTNGLLLLTLVFITLILPHENYFVMENRARSEKKEKYFLIGVKVVRTTHGFWKKKNSPIR
jgi:hypothetical protein